MVRVYNVKTFIVEDVPSHIYEMFKNSLYVLILLQLTLTVQSIHHYRLDTLGGMYVLYTLWYKISKRQVSG